MLDRSKTQLAFPMEEYIIRSCQGVKQKKDVNELAKSIMEHAGGAFSVRKNRPYIPGHLILSLRDYYK